MNEFKTMGDIIKLNVYSFTYERTNRTPNEYIDTIEGPIDTLIFELKRGKFYGALL